METNKFTGLALLFKDNTEISCEILTNTSCEWVLWTRVQLKNSFSFLLGSVYVPGQSSIYHSDNIYETLTDDMLYLLTKFDLPFMLMGDFNSRTGTLSDTLLYESEVIAATGYNDENTNNIIHAGINRYNADTVINRNGQDLISLCKSLNLRIINGRFGSDKGLGEFTCHTPRGETVVDYIIISDSLIPQVGDFSVEPLDCTLSDVHSAISMSLLQDSVIPHQINQCEHTEVIENDNTLSQQLSYKHKWKTGVNATFKQSFNTESVVELLETLNGMNIDNTTQETMNNVTNKLTSFYIETAKGIGLCKENKERKHFKEKKYSRLHPHNDWFDDECENKRTEYLTFKNEVRQIKGSRFKVFRKQQNQLLSTKHKEYKSLLEIKKRNFRINIAKKLCESKISDPKGFWNILSTKSKQKNENNISLSCFKQHFEKLNQVDTERSGGVGFNPEELTQSTNEELNKDFTFVEIKNIIKKLKNGKSCGYDNIINEYLKNSPDSVIEVIVHLFNLVLNTGIVPTDWCIGLIFPLFKNKGSKNNVDNYRGITLLSVIGKLFTSALNSRLTTYLESISALGEEQAGFRKGYSTLNHIFVLHTIIDFYLQKRKRLYCAFIDYSKAFDLIDRSKLWGKLLSSGIRGNIIKVIYNLYDSAKSCIKKGQNLSEFFHCKVGVRQGENLSPLLFAIYLNDFTDYIEKEYNGLTFLNSEIMRVLGDNMLDFYVKLFILLYADDTIILAESPQQLQLALNSVRKYCTENFLKVNLTKTKVIIFSRGKVRNIPEFFYGEEKIDIVDDYVYLGVTFNYNGSFTKAITKQIEQARKAMYSLITKSRRLELPVDLQVEIFDKTVLPVLLYGCEIWGCANIADVEVFYHKYLKLILKLGRSTPNCMVYGETGTLPLQYVIEKRILSFWMKTSEDNLSKIATKMYRAIHKLQSSGEYSFKWLNKIKDILDVSGYRNLWELQDQYKTKLPLYNNVSETIKKCIESVCLDKIESGSRCTNYRIFKVSLNFEFYLTNLCPIYRINMSKFRCGNNKLPVNQYKSRGDESDNICKLCSIGDVGDEYHFLFKCSYFHRERTLYLKPYYTSRPNTHKMKILFNTRNKKTLRNLARFQMLILSKF